MAELVADPYRAARLILALRQNGVTNPAVLKAMEGIDRGEFASTQLRSLAYDDVHLPLPAGQTIAPPLVTAQILAAADYTDPPSGRALLIGAGSGYSTAVLAGLVEEVVSVERSARLANMAEGRLGDLGVSNVVVLQGDGLSGCPDHGPFTHIFAMGTLASVPEALRSALTRDGILIAPVGNFETAELQVWREGRCVAREPLLSPLLPLRDGIAKAL